MSDENKSELEGEGRPGLDFIRTIIEDDLETGKWGGRVATRFPPEPNGYLHIGHAKSICLNFGVASQYGGTCNLRFDDTNPTKEDVEYVDAIEEDVRWLGFEWEGEERFASDYFDQLYGFAEQLIRDGKAYVDSLSAEQIREHRGTFTEPGKDSPYRERSVEENLDLLRRMRDGEFQDGEQVLRAKIDMASPNINLRDPTIYRIRNASHHRTGDRWCIYPMYDFTHCLSDSIERITHSLCTLEFEDHRPLYDWFLDQLGVFHPQQIEFARLNLSFTVMSKRKLLALVNEGVVSGWDDPRMPTICGMRRRGFTPSSIRSFTERVGLAKRQNVVDVAMLEHTVREDLNETAPRAMGVLQPLKLIIDNFPEGETEWFDCPLHPSDESMGHRRVPFTRELYIERADFMEDPPRKYYRLAPGREVRLRYACLVTCVGVDKDEDGEITAVHCTWDPESKGGAAPDGRKVKVTLHWVSAVEAIEAEVRLYDRLFDKENPDDVDEDAGETFRDSLNPDSLEVLPSVKLEPHLATAAPGSRWQFERLGYFCADLHDSTAEHLVFNRTVTLRDEWARIQKRQQNKPKR